MKRKYNRRKQSMKKKNKIRNGLFFALAGLSLTMASCNEEPDGSNLYTFTGNTVETFLQKDSNLTAFNYILQRAGMDKMMAAYGQYTCYAPTNQAVSRYIDSLYNDKEAIVAHNSMTANSLEGLSDSLCTDIAKYHLCNGLYSIIDMGGSGTTITTMLGRPISSSVNGSGKTVLNGVAVITSEDNKVTNGLVHIVNQVCPRSTRMLADELKRHADYSIFCEALQKTGLADSIAVSSKGKTYSTDYDHSDTKGEELYTPEECKVGFTVFAESNAVLAKAGINSFSDLVAYANQTYAGAPSWYDYMKENGLKVSTGNDYTNRNNALNMFVAYHILKASMAQDQMVFEDKANVAASTDKWNYVNGGEPYDYYETLLPHTIMKIWEPQPGKTLYINRYRTFNTLTNEMGTMGTNHSVERVGVKITREDITAYNGYIHPIEGMLVYDADVPNKVLHERMRFDSSSFLTELINNGFRYMYVNEVSALNGGGSGVRVAFPLDYFDNIKCLNSTTTLRYCTKGPWWASEADIFQGWGNYDVCVRLPYVPSGQYELRITYAIMGHGGMMQFYYGTNTNPQQMTALGIPLDVRISGDDPSIGYTRFYEEDDRGVASDEALRTRGYMRGPYAFTGHPGEGRNPQGDGCCRGNDQTVRKILGTINIKQKDDLWLRIKNVISDETDLKWQIDFVELVPVSIVNNDKYMEDWY